MDGGIGSVLIIDRELLGRQSAEAIYDGGWMIYNGEAIYDGGWMIYDGEAIYDGGWMIYNGETATET